MEENLDKEVTHQLPVPEISKEKKFFGDASITLPEKAMHVEEAVIERRIAEQLGGDRRAVKAAEFTQFKKFYLEAKGLMRALKPHLAQEDKEKFNTYWKAIGDILREEAHDLESIEELTEFLLQALKNANLSELGRKSRVSEIVDEIDVSEV